VRVIVVVAIVVLVLTLIVLIDATLARGGVTSPLTGY
jgi:hypothetical protein